MNPTKQDSTKKKNRRGDLTGFDGIKGKLTAKRLTNLKNNPPAGRWRSFKQMKIRYTRIHQKWTYGEQGSIILKHICPWGMVKFVSHLIQQERGSNKFSVIPNSVREGLKLKEEDFNASDLNVTCSNEGDLGYENFYVLFCTSCSTSPKFTELVTKHKSLLPENPSLVSLQEHWDDIIREDKSAHWFADFCSCLLPNEVDVLVGPNARRFILRPCDHATKHHKTDVVPNRKRPAEQNAANTLTGCDGVLKTKSACSSTGTDQSSGKKVKVTVKDSAVKFVQTNVASMLDPKVSLFESPKNDDAEFAQDFCLSLILTGVRKNLSQQAILDLYETSYEGVRAYHKKKFSKIEINNKKIPPPPRVSLNAHNINVIEKTLLESFKMLDSSDANQVPYEHLRKGPHNDLYSLFNDGIQKFTMELNGVMIRTLDAENNTVNIPWALTSIPGGSMDSDKLVDQTIDMISSIQKFRNPSFVDASTAFLKKFELEYPDTIAPTPPSIFKVLTMQDIDFEMKNISLVFDHWPVALVGDGCGVNPKAGRLLTERYGLLSPTTRCSGHAASGSIRRLTSSKTMCVEEAVTFTSGMRPILKHFKLSGKSSALLNATLEIMEMKPLKLMTWCPTRMANIIQCSTRTVKILFPLCDMLATSGVKPEEASYFLSQNCMGLLHLFSDLEKVFVVEYLRKLDTDEATIFEVFGLTEKLIADIIGIETPQLDLFLDSLTEDDNGNIVFTKDSHSITLDYTHRPTRNQAQEQKITLIQSELKKIKDKIMKNLLENIEDQNQKGTLVEFASALDFSRKSDKEVRLAHIKKLHEMYGTEYTHTFIDSDGLEEFDITIKYTPKLECTVEEMVKEFNSIWPVLNKSWMKFKDLKPVVSRVKKFWEYILSNYSIDYPNFSRLITLLLAVSPGTGPLERSFSKLAKICYKDRGSIEAETLETLYLLSALNINSDEALWVKTREELQKKGYKLLK